MKRSTATIVCLVFALIGTSGPSKAADGEQPSPTATAPAGRDAPLRPDPLSSPEALAGALQPEGLAQETPAPPRDPTDLGDWEALTAVQRERQLAEHRQRLEDYQRKLTTRKSLLDSPPGKREFLGRQVAWLLGVDGFSRGKQGDGYLLEGRSRQGHKVTVRFPQAAEDNLLRWKKGDIVLARGTIEDCRFEEHRELLLFCPTPRITLGAVLKGSTVEAPPDARHSGAAEFAMSDLAVVFVVDKSGSMAPTFDDVRKELLRTIEVLPTSARFHVIFFSPRPIEGPRKGLVVADEENKKIAREFLRPVSGSGETVVLPSLRRAFEVLAADASPTQVVYILTDGDFAGVTGGSTYRNAKGQTLQGNLAVIQWLRDHNSDKRVCVNTVLYMNPHPSAVEVMKAIAAGNGGRYRFVGSDE